MDYEQLSIQTVDDVTEITIRLGLVGAHHGQVQVDAVDETGTMIAMISCHHFDIAALEVKLAEMVAKVVDLAYRRHGPF